MVSASLSADITAAGNPALIPAGLSPAGYRAVFADQRIWSGHENALIYMALGTAINPVVTVCAAHALSRRDLWGRDGLMLLFAFAMYFSGGMIPSYMLVRNLGLLDSSWAMVLPGAMWVYNMIVMRTYFSSQIPDDLREASELDGCGHVRLLLRIVLPLQRGMEMPAATGEIVAFLRGVKENDLNGNGDANDEIPLIGRAGDVMLSCLLARDSFVRDVDQLRALTSRPEHAPIGVEQGPHDRRIPHAQRARVLHIAPVGVADKGAHNDGRVFCLRAAAVHDPHSMARLLGAREVMLRSALRRPGARARSGRTARAGA